MKFVAFERQQQGTGASRRLRLTGKVPGIVYGEGGNPVMIELDHNALFHALKREAFHSSILSMELAGKTERVLLRDYQMHPFKPLVLHIDFQRVSASHAVHVKVPLHFSGEEESPAVKLDKCLVSHVLNELEVSCLPKDLPEFIAVDLSTLVKGQSLHADDLKLPNGVTVISHGQETNPVVVSVQPPPGGSAAAADGKGEDGEGEASA